MTADDFHLQTVRAAIKVQHVPCVGKPSVLVLKVFRDANHVVQPILPVPSDYVHTCTLDALDVISDPADPLYRDSKHLVTVSPIHSVFWRKPK